MGKVKAKRRGLSETAAMKCSVKKKKLNPFEIHVNRQKFNVIGRKYKSDQGLPGISRSNAINKRKATLLKEYKGKDKSNKFFDRRIGEKDSEMTYEDRVIARLTAERVNMFKKKQNFNLADDYVLTHHGQTLSEIEKFDDPRSDEDDDDTGKLGANFVGDAHFGGGKNADSEMKRRKDIIDELILESKKRKDEKQRTRNQTTDLTDKLDTEWKDLIPIMASSKKKVTDNVAVEKPDSYDTVMRELKFAARCQASEPLKTEEEKEEEQKKKRAELEEERVRRMKAFTDSNYQAQKHRSADDLDDGFVIDDELEVTLAYDLEGNVLLDGQEKNVEILNDLKGSVKTSGGVKDSEESDDESSNSDSDDGETEDSLSDLKPSSDNETDEDHNSMPISDVEDGKSEACEDQTVGEQKEKANEKHCTATNTASVQKNIFFSNTLSENDKRLFLQKVKENNPFYTDVPENYETLHKILSKHDAEKQAIIVLQIMEKNNVSLNEMNRRRLETLFDFLMKHILDVSSQSVGNGLKVLNFLAPLMFDLIHLSPKNISEKIIDVLKQKQEEFRKHEHKYPGFDTLIIFKIISLLFPTSDFRHPVITPSAIFICQMLFQCRIKTRKDICKGLFLVTLVLEFTVLSKRFSPAAMNFLCGLLHLAIPKRLTELKSILPVPPFRKFGPYSDLLVLESKVDQEEKSLQMKLSDMSEECIDTSFKIRVLSTTLSMLNEFLTNLGNLQASPSIFYRAVVLLSRIPAENYPSSIQSKIEKLSVIFEKLNSKTLQFLVMEKKRPKALRLFEPNFDEQFDGKRRKNLREEEMEKEILLRKIKREKKSAVREIRRDNAFLAKEKLKETVQSDMERMQKVKEIFGSASTQLGELRAIERKKKGNRK